MSLPEKFTTSEEYFEECLNFFNEYHYLYSVSNVEILIRNVLDNIDVKVEEIDVFNKATDITKINDEFLVEFFSKLKRLQVVYDDFAQEEIEDGYLKDNVNFPLSAKKKHEIIHLAKLINEICRGIECDTVVDFGSGLGYLDQLIYDQTNYKVLGIESNESHYVGAKKRQRAYHKTSLDTVKYIRHTINDDSYKNISSFLTEKFDNLKYCCITGLHACADLTVYALDIFLKLEQAKAIAIMPCCYHKLAERDGVFKNFPLSNGLRGSVVTYKREDNLKVPFLRLGAQPPRVDDKLRDLVFNLLSRAVLQVYAYKHNCKLKRNRRKPVNTKGMRNNFDQYIEDATNNGFTLIKKEKHGDNDLETIVFDKEELKSMWKEISPATLKKTGIYVLLQNQLQPVIENFILYDRLIYLRENGVVNCEFKKILNERTSPRCLALVAYKKKENSLVP